jgi:UDP-2,3-diacylglucosamine hydrolase
LTTLFISDLHLQPSQPELLHACLDFLGDTARGAEALYVLGDLFEAWIGDDDDAPWLDDLVAAFRTLADAGTNLYFLHGNRDFLVGAEFARRCGLELLPELTLIDLYGRKTLLLHGDTLCTADTEYLKFRGQVRNPQWQQMILSQSLDNRRALAGALRNESKMAGDTKSMAIMDVTQDEVVRVMENENIDLMIHGHTHRPARHSLSIGGKPAERIVLGDWSATRGWYLKAAPGGEIELIEFPFANPRA